jgi:hypothetical protein
MWRTPWSGEANPMSPELDYSIYTLQQLLKARRYFDAHHYPNREKSLEEEIQKRCAHFREPTKRKGSVASATSGNQYRLYGVMAGVVFLVVSSGPFTAVEFLDAMSLVKDVTGDNAFLWGVWAVLTLPFAAVVSIIGAIMDAGRVIEWLNRG